MPAEPPANPTDVGAAAAFCFAASMSRTQTRTGKRRMSYKLAMVREMARRWGWLAVLPALAVCAAENSTGTLVEDPPGTISDLTVTATSNAWVTLSFTQVDNGTGQPANYDIRYAATPI